MAPKASKHKAANGYILPDKVPEGTILTTVTKKQFRLGKSIGVGGFGEIYLCSDDVSRPVGDDALKAVKIEPHSNGPLFVEMNFYIRAAQPDTITEFMQNKGLTSLGMPCYRGSGSNILNDEKYRFLAMDRFGNDLQKIFQSGKKLFSSKVSYNLALKIIDVLEYIHSKGYVHNDIKAQNLLLGYGRTKENDVYLVDFGLVSKYHRDGVHLEYRPDARKAHDGTIEYTSRDAHTGAHSRRSDLEILGYNLVHWMSGHLPWMDNLANFEYVEAQKKGFMSDVNSFLQRCFGPNDHPDVLVEFLEYTNSLEFDSAPDYDRCRSMFKEALVSGKHPLDGKIDFAAPKTTLKLKQKKKKRKQSGNDESDAKRPNNRAAGQQTTPSASPSPDINDFGALTRSSENSEDMDNWSWERVLCSDPEMLIRQASRQSEADDESPLALQHRALEEKKQAESLQNPTPAMLEVIQRMEEREKERENMTWQQQLQHLTGRKLSNPKVNSWDLTPNPLTPAMEEVIKMRSKRISVEIDIPITPEPSDSEDSDDDNSSHEEYVPPSLTKKKSPTIGLSSETSSKKKPTNELSSSVASFRRRLVEKDDRSNQSDEELDQVSDQYDEDDTDSVVTFDAKTSRVKSRVVSSTTPSSKSIESKRRGSVPHVVRVQSLPYSPDRIRNKGSPVKPSPAPATPATVVTSRIDLSEKLIKSMSAEETRNQIAELNRFANKRRRMSILKSENVTPLAMTATPTGAKKDSSKSRKRKMEQDDDESVERPEKLVAKKVMKSKTVTLQELLPIEEKESLPIQNVLKMKGKPKHGPRLAHSPQRLSSIPVEVCIETLGTTHVPPKKQAVTKGRARGSISKKLLVPKLQLEEDAATLRARSEADPDTRLGSRKGRSTRSNDARSTRSKDWSWEKVLLTNPDKISRKK